jgi:hypothetical protein
VKGSWTHFPNNFGMTFAMERLSATSALVKKVWRIFSLDFLPIVIMYQMHTRLMDVYRYVHMIFCFFYADAYYQIPHSCDAVRCIPSTSLNAACPRIKVGKYMFRITRGTPGYIRNGTRYSRSGSRMVFPISIVALGH